MSVRLYIEGGTSNSDSVCREAFVKLLRRAGFNDRMPRIVVCGARNSAFNDFRTALSAAGAGEFVAMLIDSEHPVQALEHTWRHLTTQDGWEQPVGASDEQVLFMTTCMEAWIVADPDTLAKHFGTELQKNALPSTDGLESRHRDELYDALTHATRNCTNAYQKGRRSFDVVGKLNPTVLAATLPSFARILRILNDRLTAR